MKIKICIATIVILFISCTSVNNINSLIATNLTVEQQKEDLIFLELKIKRTQPSLYNFITKEELQRKFDSVRNTINTPLKPNEFYFKISPLLASIRQGHAIMFPLTTQYSKKENKKLKKKGLGPISQFEYKWIDHKLLVLKNNSLDSTIQLGTEIIKIDNIKPQDLYTKYRKTFSSDGFNETFIPYAFSMRFGAYMYYELGLRDSLNYHFKLKDSVYSKVIKRLPKAEEDLKTKKNKFLFSKVEDSIFNIMSKEDKKLARQNKKKKRRYDFIYGYDPLKKQYSKSLYFTSLDSSTAVFKIKDFSRGGYRKAYKEVFELLRNKETQNLILDLRNNPGGRLNEIHELYSYLTADSTFQLIEKAVLSSKSSLLKADYLNSIPNSLYIFAIPTYPLYAGFLWAKTKKDENENYRFSMKSSRIKRHKATYFRGKIYVLINGGSYSAACIISSKLKENPEIIFVGEETGGAFNGTVAGRTSTYKLPNSNLKMRLWIMEIAATNKTEVYGRGIFPNVKIIPTLDDIISANDPEIKWVIKDIEDRK